MLADNKNKKCLAPKRDLRPSNNHIRRGIGTVENHLQKDKNVNMNNLLKKSEPRQKPQTLAYQSKYRNKNIMTVPASLLEVLSGMMVLDISFNYLNDSQIQLLMSSCQKLVTLCIQGNYNTLIPVSISKMKQLKNFNHDWANICMGTEDSNEPEDTLQLIKNYVKKPQHIIKSNKISGMNFQTYSTQVSKVTLDFILYKKIQKSRCSEPAKQAMYKCIKSFQQKTKNKIWLKNLVESQELVLGRALCGLSDRQSKKPCSVMVNRQTEIMKQYSEEQTQSGSKNIIIQDIRQISQKQLFILKPTKYSNPGMPLHEIFGNYDSKTSSHSQIDGILLRGYNPNQYDSQGLTPYHICVTQNQIKGMEYLLEISSKNPGFFDLQMPSKKQCRNILHYSVFLKNFEFTKMLIQFGFPIYKRDSSGARIIHLVDQNYQFLVMLRKLLKKQSANCRTKSILSIPLQKNKYIKHPQRIKEEGKLKNFSNSLDTMKAYQQAVSIKRSSKRNSHS